MGELFSFAEILGTVAFAVSGAMVAIDREADVFGVVFLGMTTAIGGGILRDVLLGKVPPTVFHNTPVLLTAAICPLLIFLLALRAGKSYSRRRSTIDAVNNLADALGLGAFTVTGVRMGLAAGFGDSMFFVVFLGMVTGIGGGLLRDVMTVSVPFVLKKRVYALVSLGGAFVYWLMWKWGAADSISGLVVIVLVFTIRVLATIFRWNLPRINKE